MKILISHVGVLHICVTDALTRPVAISDRLDILEIHGYKNKGQWRRGHCLCLSMGPGYSGNSLHPCSTSPCVWGIDSGHHRAGVSIGPLATYQDKVLTAVDSYAGCKFTPLAIKVATSIHSWYFPHLLFRAKSHIPNPKSGSWSDCQNDLPPVLPTPSTEEGWNGLLNVPAHNPH